MSWARNPRGTRTANSPDPPAANRPLREWHYPAGPFPWDFM
ncbi:hypothetical protein SXCC_02602 [Gluconacetobacter sp. SXCC-1]|nr:hypothetical protein SXCC_02602 [Gluconacetobacter sp. SXCC-1]